MDDERRIRQGISALWITHFSAMHPPSVEGMPNTRPPWRLPGIPLALALLALTACTGTAPEPRPITSTIAPILENEEQALAAGTLAYQKYLEVWNAIILDGGTDAARIDMVTVGELNAFEHESLTALAGLGWTFSGGISLDTFQVREWYAAPDAAGVLIVGSACVDLSASQAVDSTGQSVVQPDRPRTRTWEVHVALGGKDQAAYVLSEHQVAKEGSTCGE